MKYFIRIREIKVHINSGLDNDREEIEKSIIARQQRMPLSNNNIWKKIIPLSGELDVLLWFYKI